MENNFKFCVSAPTGKLAARYAKDLPDCRCNTVHTNYFFPVGDDQSCYNTITWSLFD